MKSFKFTISCGPLFYTGAVKARSKEEARRKVIRKSVRLHIEALYKEEK